MSCIVDMSTIQAIVPAGGEGSRLIPLTWPRTKAAMPIAGDSRLIAFMLTNLIRSRITQISIMAQKRPWSLKRFVEGYSSAIAPMLGQFIEVLTPTKDTDEFFESDRDSLIKSLKMRWLRVTAEHFLIVAGDQVVQVDYRLIAQRYFDSGTDALLVYHVVPTSQAAGRLGVLALDSENRLCGFDEKPNQPTELPELPGFCCGNLAMLLLRKEVMIEMLRGTRDLDPRLTLAQAGIPWLLENCRVIGYNLADNELPGSVPNQLRFFRDISDPDTYRDVQLGLARRGSEIDLYNLKWRLLTAPAKTGLPAKVDQAHIDQVLLGPNSIVQDGTRVQESVISRDVIIGQGSQVLRSVILDGARIGRGCRIIDTIVEKDLVVPDHTVLSAESPPSDTITLEQASQGVQWLPILTPGRALIIPKFYQPWTSTTL